MKWYLDFKAIYSSPRQSINTSADILYNECCVDRLPVSFLEIIKSQHDEKA
jgi:hypothetical protein